MIKYRRATSIDFILIALGISSSTTYAGVNIQTLVPASGFHYNFVEDIETDSFLGHTHTPGSFFFHGIYDYMDRPLVEKFSDGTEETIVRSMHSYEWRAAVILAPQALLSLHTSLNSIQIENDVTKNAFSDAILQLKYKLGQDFDESSTQYALVPELYVPLGSEQNYVSTGAFGGSIKIAAEKKIRSWRAGVNLGYRQLPSAQWRSLDYRSQTLLALGIEIPLSSRTFLNAEAAGFISLPFEPRNSPGEYAVGGRWNFAENTSLIATVSKSSLATNRNTSDGLRAMLGLKFFPEKSTTMMVSSIPRCRTETLPYTFFSRSLTEEERNNLASLPYNSTVPVISHQHPVHIKTLQLGEMTGVTAQGIPYVQDSQIVFAIDFKNLPKNLVKVEQALLKLSVNKVSTDPYLSTEILCLVQEKICSGQAIALPHWQPAINKDYFAASGRSANDLFSKQYLNHAVGTWRGNQIYSAQITLDLKSFLDGSALQLKDLLYTQQGPSIVSKSTLQWVVADDTFLQNDARMEVLLTTETCE